MYFPNIGWLFSRSTLVWLIVIGGLALWKIVDICVWLFTHMQIIWS